MTRMRRLRKSSVLRNLLRENKLQVEDLIFPVFVTTGSEIKKPVKSMPGIYNYSLDVLLKELKTVQNLGIHGIILFGIPENKDAYASEAYAENGIIQKAAAAIKENYPGLLVITDVCLCEYTDHGHCGLIKDKNILNDETLTILQKIAVSHARSGADIVAPSDMMDGRVAAIRKALDREYYTDIPIMAYSAKYASAFYGPFREAADSTPQFGDRKTYQMDPPNSREAIREIELDINEGADIVMIKPSIAYMDIISRSREYFDHPLAAYNVSGEYSMIKAASAQGWIDEKAVVLESLTGLKRAGADIIISYHAVDAAQWLQEI
ncbi:MAG: porphobilinogen synthase [Clostridiales bacterium]|nr:porphobilinogen synthase [Clostridiales bacterium]MCF8021930.1 porphobilinogen synthase [Clostridiales bacterium]